MAWWVLGAALGAATSLIGGNQQRDAAEEQNELAEERAKAQFERAEKEWAIDYEQRLSNYAWKLAETEAARFIDRQKKSDYEQRQGQIIESAMRNLEVNKKALNDKYIVSEGLRRTQEELAIDNKMTVLANDSNEAIRQYMIAIQQKGLEAQTLLNKTQTEGQALQTDIVNGYAEEAVRRDAESVTALVASSLEKNKAIVRSGGSSSAHRQSLNALQALGRSYGGIKQRNQARQSRLGIFNSTMQGEVASQMGQYALAIGDNAERLKYTKNKYAQEGTNALDVFRELTIPSFDLAKRQGEREMESLYIGTEGRIDEASMPFRESIIFDPLEPIAGLRPEYYAPTKVYEPTGLDIALGTVQGGVQGAMQFSYQKEGGGLGFF